MLDHLLAEARSAGLDRLDAQLLAAHALGRTRAWVIAHGDDVLAEADAARVRDLLARRAAGEPVAYLLGTREFLGREFAVTPDVLIPRPDTELLVERALDGLPPGARVLELATGSGCIAVSIALARPDCTVTATDLSPGALAVARGNAARLGARIDFRHGDWWGALAGGAADPAPGSAAEPDAGPFDLIVSNPPYIAAADPHLAQGDLRFEPAMALASGADGLDAIREIVAGAPARLAPGGRLLLEHGWDQAEAVRALLAAAGLRGAKTWRDLGDNDRVSGASL